MTDVSFKDDPATASARIRLFDLVLAVVAIWALLVLPSFVFSRMHVAFFNWPLARWLIPSTNLAVAAILCLCRYRERRARQCLTRLPESHVKPWWRRRLGRLGDGRGVATASSIVQWLAVLTLANALAALVAGPAIGERPFKVRANQLRIVALIDESFSLNAEDCEGLPISEDEPFGPHNSRMQEVQASLERLLEETTDNALALSVFASQGLMLQPRFVFNHAPLWYEIKTLTAGSVPGGTRSDLSNGFQTAIDFIEKDKKKNSGNQRYMIVLFSDGGFSVDAGYKEEPQARLAKQLSRVNTDNIALVIAGLGSDSPVPIPQYQRNQEGFLTKVGDLKIGGRIALTFRDRATLEAIHRQVPGSQLIRLRTPDDLRIDWHDAVGDERMRVDAAPASLLFATVAAIALVVRLLIT